MSIKTNKIKVNVDFSHSSKTVVYWTEVYLRKYKTSKVTMDHGGILKNLLIRLESKEVQN
jgi:hypothetical protein